MKKPRREDYALYKPEECNLFNIELEKYEEYRSKRFQAATMAMHGILSNYIRTGSNDLDNDTIKDFVKLSYIVADELLKQENE